MKKIYLFFLLCLAAAGMQAQEQLPTWAHDLYNQNRGVIDSINLYRANREKALKLADEWCENGYIVVSMKDDFRTIYGYGVEKTDFSF